MDINRGRLIQERWLSLFRWLLIEACLVQGQLLEDPHQILERPIVQIVVAFAAYTLIVTLAAAFRPSWPAPLAYATAAVDSIAASAITGLWPGESFVNPGILGAAMAAIGVGLRRFPVFDTFAYSLLIAVAIVAMRFLTTLQLPLSDHDALVVATVALLAVLARASTLAPNQGVRDDPAGRLLGPGRKSLSELEAASGDEPEHLYLAAAKALATYAGAQVAGLMIRELDQGIRLYTVTEQSHQVDRLPPPTSDGSLVSRLVAVRESVIFGKRDDLGTRGLPDQYPPRLDNLVAAPIPGIDGGSSGTLLAVNRRGGQFRIDDQIMTDVLAREVARLRLSGEATNSLAELRVAATDALLAAAEAKRPGSRAQAEECGRFAVAIAHELGWAEDQVQELYLAALLHDVGELAIPDSVLDKADALTPEEFEAVKVHPRSGAKMIDYFNRSELILHAVHSHHEHWDGRGYPSGLAGEAIPMAARILTLADAVESMLRPTPYRAALQVREAIQEVVQLSGAHFDPSLVQVFLAMLGREGEGFLGHTDQATPPAPRAGRYRGAR
jgi:HD-GYP domain-containing protein (c-di-GMP phosphodiesterase class II)